MEERTEGVSPGMEVVGVDDQHIGRVKEVREDRIFRVDCRMAPDYYIPADAVRRVADGKVILRVTKSQASYMGWEVKPEH